MITNSKSSKSEPKSFSKRIPTKSSGSSSSNNSASGSSFSKTFPIDQMHHHLAIQEAKKVFQGVYLVDPAEGHLHLTAQEAKAFQEASRVRALISL